MRFAAIAIAGLLAAATPASAANWSVIGAQTVGSGADVLYGEFGWPDVSLNYVHGMGHDFDLGGRMQLIYGIEGRTHTEFGMAFAVPLRWTFYRHKNVSLLLHGDPGIRFYATDPALFALQLIPFGVNFEVQPTRDIKVGMGMDFTSHLFVSGVGDGVLYSFGPLFGPFVEYHFDPQVAVGIDTRFGVNVLTQDGNTNTEFAFRAQAVLAYRL